MSEPTPYADAAEHYWSAGWTGILPIPYRSKTLQKKGWTGHHGAWPSYPDIRAWLDNPHPDEGGGNIALRLPHDVIGIDVDAYDGKNGAATLSAAESQHGPLPATWRTTSRDDGISGIRLYRVPEGLAWPGQIGPHTEIIQYCHRYALVWPSIHPDTGGTYRWINPDGVTSTVIPHIDALPELPDAWLVGITGGVMAEPVNTAGLSVDQTNGWLILRHHAGLCGRMQRALDRMLAELGTGSAHESLRHLVHFVRLAEQGHTGLLDAVGQAHTAFIGNVTHPRAGQVRDRRDAEAEWHRSLTGAVNRVLGSPSADANTSPEDPCATPFGDFVGLVSAATHTAGSAALAPLTAPSTEPGPEPDDGTERTTWWPRDLASVIAGTDPELPPAVLVRDDDRALFYAGKVNGLLGESESGKTWVILLGVAQELAAGRHVLYIDCEDTASGIVSRLRDLGTPDEQLSLLTYIGPEESLHSLASTDLTETLEKQTYSTIVLDGVNAAMTLLGLELESNTDATKFAQVLLRPLARTGAAVITVDHVPKNKEQRGKGGIGAQAKRAMVTGCALSVEVLASFGRGQTGKLKLTVDKDRPGHVRGTSAFANHAGTAILSSDADTGNVTVIIEAPDLRPFEEREPFRPTHIMERISHYLSTVDGALSLNAIETSIEGKATAIRAALNVLVQGGYVARESGPRGAVLHSHKRRYTVLSDLYDDSEDGVENDG